MAASYKEAFCTPHGAGSRTVFIVVFIFLRKMIRQRKQAASGRFLLDSVQAPKQA